MLDASEERRRQRARDTTADTIGLALKRGILEAIVRDDPDPDGLNAWLLERCLAAPPDVSVGAMRAMAIDVLTEYQLASSSSG
jgi:hypothetical protein